MVSTLAALRRLDPLVLFLIIGLALYLVLDATGLLGADERVIVVDEGKLAAFTAGQAAAKDLARMTPAERRALVDGYVREEALYREALGLGLDRNDNAIRRRLIQSLEFSLQEAGERNAPKENELRAYFDANRERYAASGTVRFAHVFFDKAKRGEAAAELAARQALPSLAAGDWLAAGDRFPYRREYEASEAVLAAELGSAAAQRVFALPVRPERWQGPIESDLGFHLVRMEERSPLHSPAFEKVRGQVAAAVVRERQAAQLRSVVDRIVADYQVEVTPALQQALQ